jgi:hypothetical protein
MRPYSTPEGATWNVDVKLPSHSGAMLVFQHAGGQSVAADRYAWINAALEATTDPRERLKAGTMLDGLSDAEIARLFRRSMAVKRLG